MWRILTWLFFFLAKFVSSGFIETQTSRSSSCTGSLSFHHYHTDEFITKITDTSLRIVLSSGRDKVKIKIEGNCCFYVFNRKKCRGVFIRTSRVDSLRPSSHIGEISAVKISSWENGCAKNQSMVKKVCRDKIKDFQNIEKSGKHARQEQVVGHFASETDVTVNKTEKVVLDATEPMIQNRKVENDEMKIIEDSPLNIFNEIEEVQLHMVESTDTESIKIDEEVKENSTDLIADIVNKVQEQVFNKVENVTHKTASVDNITMAQAGISTSSEGNTKVEQTTMTMLDESKVMSIITEGNTDKIGTEVNKIEQNTLLPTTKSDLHNETYIFNTKTEITKQSNVEQTTMTMLDESKVMSIITEGNTVKTGTEVNKIEENMLLPTTKPALNTETYIFNTKTEVTKQSNDYEPTEVTIIESILEQNYANKQILSENNSISIEAQKSSTVEYGDQHSARLVIPKQEIVEIAGEETIIKTKTTTFNDIKNLESEELQLSPNNISDINITKHEAYTTMINSIVLEYNYESNKILNTNIEAEENKTSDTSESSIIEENTLMTDTNMFSNGAFILKDETAGPIRQNITEKNINLDMLHPLSNNVTPVASYMQMVTDEMISSRNSTYPVTENPQISDPSIETVIKNINGTYANFGNTERTQSSLNDHELSTTDIKMESREMTPRRNHTYIGTDGLKIPQASSKILSPTTTDVTMVTERTINIEIDLASTNELETTSMKSEEIKESKDMKMVTEDERTVIKDSVTNLKEITSVKIEYSKFQLGETSSIKKEVKNINDQQESNFEENYNANSTENVFVIEISTSINDKHKEIQNTENSIGTRIGTFNASKNQEENIQSESTTINPNKTEVIKYKNTYTNITYLKYKRMDENITNPSSDIKTKIEEKVSEKLWNDQNINPIQNDESFSHHFFTNKTGEILQNEPSTESINSKNNSENIIPTKKEPFSKNSRDKSEIISYKFIKPQSYSSSHGTRTFSNINSIFISIIFYTLLIRYSSCYSY